MRRLLFFLCLIGCGTFLPAFSESAEAATMLYRHKHFLFPLDAATLERWQSGGEVWKYRGKEITPPPEWLVDGDAIPALPAGVLRTAGEGWNQEAIRRTLENVVVPVLHRDPGSVTIKREGSGSAITFEGVGLPGRSIDVDAAVALTLAALEQNIDEVELPVREVQPSITVTDPTLAAEGIAEVLSVGESNFANSPNARRHNIAVGLSKFNGAFVPKGATFSFNDILGPVDAAAGYKLELVIKGDRTVPDYGGGLCQISSTAYRGVWEYGFPIPRRKNHSYSVRYYFPEGTDATVFPPYVDMQFKNDSPGAVLVQTHQEKDNAYFIYYGTRDDRVSQVIGPYIWDRVSPPPERTEYTTEIPPGTTKKIGERVPGLKAMWYRIVERGGEEEVESVFSQYEARPLFHQIGVEASQLPGSIDTPEPPRVF